MKPLQSLVRPNVWALEPYSTARDEYKGSGIGVFLDANENPYNNGLNRYPDPHQALLKDRIAGIKGIAPENLFLGNGSDEAIDLMYRIFCVPGVDNAIAMAPSYGMYSVAADTNDVEVRRVMLCPDFSMDVPAMLAAADEHSKLMFVCSPNNPSANSFPPEDIEALLSGFEGIVVLDEAYIDFSVRESFTKRIGEFPNLVVLQTLSKAWGLAGLRVGLAVASPEIIGLMSKVKYPYNINVLAQQTVLDRLSPALKDRQVAEILSERTKMEEALADNPLVRKIYHSDSNFLLVRFDDADAVYDALLARGIIVRNRNSTPGCRGCLRLTVGTPFENERLIGALEDICGSKASAGGKTDPFDGRIGERHVVIRRTTGETDVTVEIDLDRPGTPGDVIDTGLKFFDHMLSQLPHHGGIALSVHAKGDLEVDEHHTIEDVAITLGEAIDRALGSKKGIERYGFALPMDECDAMVLMDLGGRIDFSWDVEFTRERVGDVPTEMFRHFFQSLCNASKCNLHIVARGENNHHKIEAVFKAYARTLRMAVSHSRFPYELPSSKGML